MKQAEILYAVSIVLVLLLLGLGTPESDVEIRKYLDHRGTITVETSEGSGEAFETKETPLVLKYSLRENHEFRAAKTDKGTLRICPSQNLSPKEYLRSIKVHFLPYYPDKVTYLVGE